MNFHQRIGAIRDWQDLVTPENVMVIIKAIEEKETEIEELQEEIYLLQERIEE
ncbi:hypothetical protein [Izhakiella australiensis]|uniref:hypothetical protein n=1 Tax=Izhakiella australiensis TaxID=1926881 RepID=UPI001590EDD6|nr:hypothetical protein [Izhakiella australiensis]